MVSGDLNYYGLDPTDPETNPLIIDGNGGDDKKHYGVRNNIFEEEWPVSLEQLNE